MGNCKLKRPVTFLPQSSLSDAKVPPHSSQTSGLWSRTSSGSSASRRLCGSCPGFAPPGRALSRFAFLSVEGGLDEVREVFSGCCNCRTSSINCSLLSCRKSSPSIPSWIQTFHSRARGWAITTPRRGAYAGAERRMGRHTSLHDTGNRRCHLRRYHHGPGENRRPVNRLNTQPENNLHHLPGHYRAFCGSRPVRTAAFLKSVDLLLQIAEKSARIDVKSKKMKSLAAETDTARRLRTMPGAGPLTALAVEAFAPDMAQFKCGRDFAAWLGHVPRQYSSGGKERLGRVSKAGQRDIRRLLTIGAMSRLNWLGRRTILQGSWLAKILAREPNMLVAIALANKMARQLWAMVTKNEDYRDPALAAAA